jgi:hypothetical protein
MLIATCGRGRYGGGAWCRSPHAEPDACMRVITKSSVSTTLCPRVPVSPGRDASPWLASVGCAQIGSVFPTGYRGGPESAGPLRWSARNVGSRSLPDQQVTRSSPACNAAPKRIKPAFDGVSQALGGRNAGQPFWVSVNLSGTMTSSRVRSWMDALPSPYSVSLMPWRRISSTLLTPRSPFAARPHR